MELFKTILTFSMVAGFITFVIWSCIAIFCHKGPDESHSRTRYAQTQAMAKKAKSSTPKTVSK